MIKSIYISAIYGEVNRLSIASYHLASNNYYRTFSIDNGYHMNKWFYFNGIALIIIIWKITQYPGFPFVPAHIILGFIGVLFIFMNWTRHAVFSTIRSDIDRERKIKYANYAKKVIPYHRWIGTTALFIVIIHASKVISTFGFSLQNMKVLSGTLTGLILIGMVTSGWLRLIWPSKRKRMTHIYLGLTMFFLIVIHILL